MRFAVPFKAALRALQLRAFLAGAGLDPDRDVTMRVTPPRKYVSQLRVGSVDGFFGGEPALQRAVFEVELWAKQHGGHAAIFGAAIDR